jgi:cell division protein FtsZ
MIPYSRDPHQVISSDAIRIIGLGGAGTNMLERIVLDGVEGADPLALNTDARTLASCMAPAKIQLGANITKGLGAGGDPELGLQAVLEAEEPIRAALRGRRIVFVCAGLGGGTGSGGAPIVTRIAREEGAFVVVFATMPFAFEGKRRRDQAETALNELAVLANALVTFDNNRMGELVLAKAGVHDAFSAADRMICESIKAVIRLVARPGLINIGLDELMSALRTNRSRCLFGSGIASGKDRSAKALRNALASPLLDQGSLLKEARTVLVHLGGGESLTLFEIELLMQQLRKHVPETAQVLFGAAVDPAMGDSLSITLISALPEDALTAAPRESLSRAAEEIPMMDPVQGFAPDEAAGVAEDADGEADPVVVDEADAIPGLFDAVDEGGAAAAGVTDEEAPMVAEFVSRSGEAEEAPAVLESDFESELELDPEPILLEVGRVVTQASRVAQVIPLEPAEEPVVALEDVTVPELVAEPEPAPQPPSKPDSAFEVEAPKLKLGVKPTASQQDELSLDSAPRGRFEGQGPNVFEGEDLDLPPFLRKKR